MAKATARPKRKDSTAILGAMADELGALERELVPLKFKFARAEKLRKDLRAAFDGQAAEKSFEVKGERFVVGIGAVVGAGVAVSYVSPGYRTLKIAERAEELHPLSRKTD